MRSVGARSARTCGEEDAVVSTCMQRGVYEVSWSSERAHLWGRGRRGEHLHAESSIKWGPQM